MKYMLLMYWDPAEVPPFTHEEQQTLSQSWFALTTEMQNAGVWEANNGLSPVSDATSVRVRDGKTLIADGPFAETHEHFGGYYLLNCKDLDEALDWAAKIPSAKYGTVEVRPMWSQK